LDDCPAQYLIPIYLLVGGVVSVCLDLSGILQSCCEQKKKDSQPSAFTRFCKFSESIIGTFMLVWFICGELCRDVCVWSFRNNSEQKALTFALSLGRVKSRSALGSISIFVKDPQLNDLFPRERSHLFGIIKELRSQQL